MRDEKEGRKKQARSNKQHGKATQHTQGSHFSYMYVYLHEQVYINVVFHFQLWMEFVPLWEVKAQQVILVEEWFKVESYQKTLPSHTPKSTPDNGE